MHGTSAERHEWLEKAAVHVRKLCAKHGIEVPENVRVSVGWPFGTRKAIGQCFCSGSVDKCREVFISPIMGSTDKRVDSRRKTTIHILDVLAHEFVHAALPEGTGHKALFAKTCAKIDLVGKPTSTVPGPDFIDWAKKIVEKIGLYPAGALIGSTGKKTQTTRMLKCCCDECGYTVRTTQKWIAEAGAPICPTDEIVMEVE